MSLKIRHRQDMCSYPLHHIDEIIGIMQNMLETQHAKLIGDAPLRVQQGMLKFVAHCGKISHDLLQRWGGTISFTEEMRVEKKDSHRVSWLVRCVHAWIAELSSFFEALFNRRLLMGSGFFLAIGRLPRYPSQRTSASRLVQTSPCPRSGPLHPEA